MLVNAQQAMPAFRDLPADVQKDIGSELSYELKLSPLQLRTVLADITRAMPGIDQAYLAVVEDSKFGDIKARFDIGIIYGTQGSTTGLLANLINYSINQ